MSAPRAEEAGSERAREVCRIPPIDREIPGLLSTATFALG